MEFEKLISPSLKELFISNIEAKILSGELPVGQQLPPERQLAQSMGVSRAVVNSGIVELENRGFWMSVPGWAPLSPITAGPARWKLSNPL